jgi:hypothetical protein
VFNKENTDLGQANNFEYKIYLKEAIPVYVKLFPMLEVYRDILEGQVRDWLKKVSSSRVDGR